MKARRRWCAHFLSIERPEALNRSTNKAFPDICRPAALSAPGAADRLTDLLSAPQIVALTPAYDCGNGDLPENCDVTVSPAQSIEVRRAPPHKGSTECNREWSSSCWASYDLIGSSPP